MGGALASSVQSCDQAKSFPCCTHEIPEGGEKCVLRSRGGFGSVGEWQHRGCRKVNLGRVERWLSTWWALGRRTRPLAAGCKTLSPWDAKVFVPRVQRCFSLGRKDVRPRAAGMARRAVPLRLRWLRSRCPIPISLFPAGSRGARRSAAGAARLIFSSVPSLAPAPTSSPYRVPGPHQNTPLYKPSQQPSGAESAANPNGQRAHEAGMPTPA